MGDDGLWTAVEERERGEEKRMFADGGGCGLVVFGRAKDFAHPGLWVKSAAWLSQEP